MEAVGTILDERWRIESQLGRGGMARVYLARDLVDDHLVAIKILEPAPGRNQALETRFRREFEATSRLDHPNVVHLHGFGGLEGGAMFYVMDYLDCPSLHELLEGEGRLAPRRAIAVGKQIASAFAYFHPLGIVHRDVKPPNVMVRSGDRVVLVDFGLVRDLTRTALTTTGAWIGTPSYMAPEQIGGAPADRRTDLYQLGVLLYEMVGGQVPFRGRSFQELAGEIQKKRHRSLGEVVEGLDPRWNAVLDLCLAKDPARRYPDAAVLLADLEVMGDSGLDDPLPSRTIELPRGDMDDHSSMAKAVNSSPGSIDGGSRISRRRRSMVLFGA